jgi:hypothetical protein
MEDSMVESPEGARHRARPDRRTPSLGCVPMHSADLIMEALHAIIRPAAARVSVAVSMVEAAATNFSTCAST